MLHLIELTAAIRKPGLNGVEASGKRRFGGRFRFVLFVRVVQEGVDPFKMRS